MDAETGLYYYGARFYDPRISVWLSIDPLSESFYDDSPFTYALNNPIYFIDPTGMSSEPNNGDETDCSKKGSCVQLQEVLITVKAKSSNPYDNPNVAAHSRANSKAVNNTPATRNIDQGIKDFTGMFNPIIAGIYILDDLNNNREVENLDYVAAIPAFKIFKITKYGTIIEKTIPVVKVAGHTKPWILMSKAERKAFQHSYSRHGAELGLPNWAQSKASELQNLFNNAVTNIRNSGASNFFQSEELVNGVKTIVNRTEPIINGQKYYYYETIGGKFVSAGKMP